MFRADLPGCPLLRCLLGRTCGFFANGLRPSSRRSTGFLGSVIFSVSLVSSSPSSRITSGELPSSFSPSSRSGDLGTGFFFCLLCRSSASGSLGLFLVEDFTFAGSSFFLQLLGLSGIVFPLAVSGLGTSIMVRVDFVETAFSTVWGLGTSVMVRVDFFLYGDLDLLLCLLRE